MQVTGQEGRMGMQSIAQVIEPLGWQERDPLAFPAKKLNAKWWAAPPGSDLPRIFVSQLEVFPLSKQTIYHHRFHFCASKS